MLHKMWGLIIKQTWKRVGPLITVPFAAIIGLIGYSIENILSDKYTPSLDSVKDKRDERLLEADQEIGSLKEKKFVPKTIFEKNVSPSLLEPDNRKEKYMTQG